MPSSLTEIGLKIRLGELCNGELTELEAMELLESYAELGLEIPTPLNPYVAKAITGWRKEPGKTNIRKIRDRNWSVLVDLVERYRLTGDTLTDAIDRVVSECPEINGKKTNADTLKTHYDRAGLRQK